MAVDVQLHRIPPEAIDFLVELAQNNDRAWFQPRKSEFEALLKDPMEAMVAALAEAFDARGLPLQADPEALDLCGSTATPGLPKTSRLTRPTWARASRGSRAEAPPRCRTPSMPTARTSTSSPARISPVAACGTRPSPSSTPSDSGSSMTSRASVAPSRTELSSPSSGRSIATSRSSECRPAIRRITRWPTCSATRTWCSAGAYPTMRSTARPAGDPRRRVQEGHPRVHVPDSLDD